LSVESLARRRIFLFYYLLATPLSPLFLAAARKFNKLLSLNGFVSLLLHTAEAGTLKPAFL
jgi:hypothetical protein